MEQPIKVEGTKYTELVEFIMKLESKIEENTVQNVDISEFFVKNPEIQKKPSYKEMIGIIEGLQSKKAVHGEIKMPQVQQQSAKKQVSEPHMKELAMMTREELSEMIKDISIIPKEIENLPIASIEKKIIDIKEDIFSAKVPKVKKSQVKTNQVKTNQVKTDIYNNLLTEEIKIPNIKKYNKKVQKGSISLADLSIPDQTSELEKIIEGIKENAFNKENLSIIWSNLVELAETLNQKKKELKKNRPTLEKSETLLWILRDKRLREAFSVFSVYYK